MCLFLFLYGSEVLSMLAVQLVNPMLLCQHGAALSRGCQELILTGVGLLTTTRVPLNCWCWFGLHLLHKPGILRTHVGR